MKDESVIKHEKEKATRIDSGKKTYHSPQFQVYGSLNSLTQAKGGIKSDSPGGGPPFTKH